MVARRAAAAAVWLIVGASLLALPGGTPSLPRPSSGVTTVVALGDSVPAGTACHCTPFPDLYAGLVSPRAVNLALRWADQRILAPLEAPAALIPYQETPGRHPGAAPTGGGHVTGQPRR